jgi:hypothetical protein
LDEAKRVMAVHDAVLTKPLVEALDKLPGLRNPGFTDDAYEVILERGTRDECFDVGYDKGDLDCREKVHKVVTEIRAALAPYREGSAPKGQSC